MSILTRSDVDLLRNEPSAVIRAQTAEKVALVFSSGSLGEQERSLATGIFAILAKDAEVLVRRRLSQALQHAPDLPASIAQALAMDAIDVATPMLYRSMALSDDDLLAVIRHCSAAHSLAVAQRRYVSPAVSGALIALGDEAVATTLLVNANAQIDEPGYHRLVDIFGQVPRIMDMASLRSGLPFSIVERIVTLVADQVHDRLVRQYGLSRNHVSVLATHGKEQVLLDMFGDDADPSDIEDMVEVLVREGRLTPTLVLRAICLGEFVFAALALAQLGNLPFANTWQLLLDQGLRGASQLYDRCWLPPRHKQTFVEVLGLARRSGFTGDPREREVFRRQVHDWAAEQLRSRPDAIGFDQAITRLMTSGTIGSTAPGDSLLH